MHTYKSFQNEVIHSALSDPQDGVGVAVEVEAAERVRQQGRRQGAAEERLPGEHHQPVRGEEQQEAQRLRM